jgi:hypothetical protein
MPTTPAASCRRWSSLIEMLMNGSRNVASTISRLRSSWIISPSWLWMKRTRKASVSLITISK